MIKQSMMSPVKRELQAEASAEADEMSRSMAEYLLNRYSEMLTKEQVVDICSFVKFSHQRCRQRKELLKIWSTFPLLDEDINLFLVQHPKVKLGDIKDVSAQFFLGMCKPDDYASKEIHYQYEDACTAFFEKQMEKERQLIIETLEKLRKEVVQHQAENEKKLLQEISSKLNNMLLQWVSIIGQSGWCNLPNCSNKAVIYNPILMKRFCRHCLESLLTGKFNQHVSGELTNYFYPHFWLSLSNSPLYQVLLKTKEASRGGTLPCIVCCRGEESSGTMCSGESYFKFRMSIDGSIVTCDRLFNRQIRMEGYRLVNSHLDIPLVKQYLQQVWIKVIESNQIKLPTRTWIRELCQTHARSS